jgi:hypothetical protein
MFSHTQFGLSYVILTFDDNATDYFARQQVLERLQTIDLPDGVQPQLAPLSTAIGEIYRYELASVGVDSVIVEPGVYATRFFENAAANPPADAARGRDYGELYELGRTLAARRPPPGDPQEVADAIATLVELPAGTRPLRTAVGAAAARAQPLNDAAAELQRTVLTGMGMIDVVTLAQPRDAREG